MCYYIITKRNTEDTTIKQNEMNYAVERATKLEATIVNSANIITATIIANTTALLVWLAC